MVAHSFPGRYQRYLLVNMRKVVGSSPISVGFFLPQATTGSPDPPLGRPPSSIPPNHPAPQIQPQHTPAAGIPLSLQAEYIDTYLYPPLGHDTEASNLHPGLRARDPTPRDQDSRAQWIDTQDPTDLFIYSDGSWTNPNTHSADARWAIFWRKKHDLLHQGHLQPDPSRGI